MLIFSAFCGIMNFVHSVDSFTICERRKMKMEKQRLGSSALESFVRGTDFDIKQVSKRKITCLIMAFEDRAHEKDKIETCSRMSDEQPVIVNCAGCTYTGYSDRFHTVHKKGRVD